MPPRARPTIGRLLARAVRAETGCVLFTGHLDKQGYGRIFHDGEKRLVHRVAYEIFVGPIPEGYEVDHLCFVRNCINTEHLEAVTPLENTRRAERGQARKTHCIHGHRFDEANTRRHRRADGTVQRICRRCDADRAAAHRERLTPDDLAERRRAYLAANREQINARRRQRHAERKAA